VDKLIGFPELAWDRIFKRLMLEHEYGERQSKKKQWYTLIKIFLLPFFPRESYFLDSKKSKILFFLSYTERKNVKEGFLSVRNLVEADLIQTNFGFSSFCFTKGVKLLFYYVPKWFPHTDINGLNLSERLRMLEILIVLYRLNDFVKTIDLNYNILVTYYDSLERESYMVEYFRHLGLKTASLQHGQFVGWRDNTFIDSGIEFNTFKSDYLLCWNQYTYDEALKAGIEKEKLIITGMWTYLNKKRELCKKNRNGIFGIVISHPSWHEENVKMVEAANMLSEQFNLSYYIKLHPFYKEDSFNSNINNHFKSNVEKSISVLDYANMVDFTIVGSSSLFTELIYIGHDVYRFSSGKPNDKYNAVKIGKFFSTPEELVSVYLKNQNDNFSDQLFDYLCTIEDPTLEYKKFLNNFEK